jgi:hypothetical protein
MAALDEPGSQLALAVSSFILTSKQLSSSNLLYKDLNQNRHTWIG